MKFFCWFGRYIYDFKGRVLEARPPPPKLWRIMADFGLDAAWRQDRMTFHVVEKGPEGGTIEGNQCRHS